MPPATSSPPIDRARRRAVMARSAKLGHCVCDVRQPCPCPDLAHHDRCACAGERPEADPAEPVRLTRHVHAAGCAAKIGKAELERLLEGLPDVADPRILCGRADADDAGVIALDPATGTVLTVDALTPPVDDPYDFGRIAAANALSDVYAMGAVPQVALSLVGFPVHTLPGTALRAIVQGGIDAMAEAGISVIGGQSLASDEPMAGYAVVGTCPAGRHLTHAGARPGDALVLTKPLGTGVIGFAAAIGRAEPAWLAAATATMRALNRAAGELAVVHGASACTDITGFGLLGHCAGIAEKSGVAITLDVDALPLLPGAERLARQDVLPGAVERNRMALTPGLLDADGLGAAQLALCTAPETSGGLLVALSGPRARAYVADLAARGVTAVIVGTVDHATPGGRIRLVTTRAAETGALAISAGTGTGGSGLGAARTGALRATVACCSAPTPVPPAASCCAPQPPAPSPQPPAAGPRLPPPSSALPDALCALNAEGELPLREKKLINLALSVALRCGPCVELNADAARTAGAGEGQLREAIDLGLAFGGATALMAYQQLRKP